MLHVGARYYDPSLGRFLQRDPMGLVSGPNPYAYALAPTSFVDPTGNNPELAYALGVAVGVPVGYYIVAGGASPALSTQVVTGMVITTSTYLIGKYCVMRFWDWTGITTAGVVGHGAADIASFQFGFYAGAVQGAIAGLFP